jgi:hypothetical protein
MVMFLLLLLLVMFVSMPDLPYFPITVLFTLHSVLHFTL